MKSNRRSSSGMRALLATALPTRTIIHFDAGETIVSQGGDCTNVHCVEEGVVKLTLVSNRGKSAVLGILREGDFFGEACMNGQSVYATSAIALMPSSISVIKRKAMMRLVNEDPSVSSGLIAYLLVRNARIEQDLIDHLFNSSEKRLARILLRLAKHGNGGKLPPILEHISQDTLAEMVGTTRSRVNFFMNKFRKLGFIHYNGGLKVHDSLARVLHA